jgi:hypothetical protein
LTRFLTLPIAWLALACSDPLEVGNDIVWSADQELTSLEQWTRDGSGELRAPRRETDPEAVPPIAEADSSIEASSEHAHRGRFAVKLVTPADYQYDYEGPELLHTAGALSDAYYSAWFMLPRQHEVQPHLTVMRLRSRGEDGELFNGEELQLRSLPSGGYVLQVFSNHPAFLLEPIADPPPLIEVERWFQLEARYEAEAAGRLRVWLDGRLVYDLPERPGASAPEIVLGVCAVVSRSSPAPLELFVDDAAVSLSRVGPRGKL